VMLGREALKEVARVLSIICGSGTGTGAGAGREETRGRTAASAARREDVYMMKEVRGLRRGRKEMGGGGGIDESSLPWGSATILIDVLGSTRSCFQRAALQL